MNYNKVQKEIFNALVSRMRVCGYWVDEDHYFVTGNGYHGYILPKAVIAFDVGRVNEIRRLFEIDEINKPENEIKLTDYIRLLSTKTMARVFINQDGRKIYLNTKYLENFRNQNMKYYQQKENEVVLVVETVNDNVFPVGVVLPLRVYK